jgi:glycogen operon protein
VLYEAHVRGLTMQHPQVPAEHRGTYLGLTAPAVLEHLVALGITAVELLPVHAHDDEARLRALGLSNYWGYNTFAFFAPDPRYATAAARTDPAATVREFKTMVRALHGAGLEVILDVVYNHTAEGPEDGPVLSWRGLDPARIYRRDPRDRRRLDNWSGCGNTLDLDDDVVRALVRDSLHYWVEEMHVDGFRFDLASALDRDPGRPTSFFSTLQHDPVLAHTKLIAEPWDATGDGYRLGAFPAGVAEWNGRYRDTVRRFWRGDAGVVPELATRLSGSQDLFGAPDRTPLDSVNFVTSHDGFTLADLVSYAEKHNEGNGEGNRDGETQNFSDHAGIEGPTLRADVLARRATRQRSVLATLALSAGVPMVSGGDELGRTQHGNNNAYCQDGPLSWTHWEGADRALQAFARDVFRFRHACIAARPSAFLSNDTVTWLREDGVAMTTSDWESPDRRRLGMRRHAPDAQDVLAYFNAGNQPATCRLPADVAWRPVLISTYPTPTIEMAAGAVVVPAGSLVVLIASR